MGRKAQKLTIKERQFIDAYLGSAGGNATEACRMAGYKGTAAVLKVQGSRMLTKANIRAEVERRQEARTAKAILDADQRDILLSAFAQKKGARLQDRIASIKELNRVTGRHSLTLKHKGKLTLEEAMEASRHV